MGTDRLTDEEADMMLKIADRDGDGVLESIDASAMSITSAMSASE